MNLKICVLWVSTPVRFALLLLPAALAAPAAAAPIASVTRLLSAPNPAVVGVPVTFTAGVNFTANQPATGTITLTDTYQGVPSVLGTIALDPTTGAGTFSTSTLVVGLHNVVASYGGDSQYNASSSQALQQTILSSFTPTTTTLVSSASPSTVAESVTFSAAVVVSSLSTMRPTGTVTFYDGANVLGTGSVVNGGGTKTLNSASLATSSLASGSHNIQAIYSGDNVFAGSTSPIVVQVVQVTGNSGAPLIGSGGIVNAASDAPGEPPNGLARGSYFSIFGTGLGPDPGVQQPFDQFPLPPSLGGVTVQIVIPGSSPAQTYPTYLIFVSSTQINGIIPSNVPLGPAQVIVTYNGTSSLPANIQVSATRFGVFYQAVGGNNVAVAQNPIGNYPLNSPTSPAQPADPSKPGTGIVLVWGTGLGAVAGGDNVPPGTNAGNMLPNLPVTVTVGGLPAQAIYAGRQSQSAGADNIYFLLPSGVPFGCNVPVAITAGGIQANTTTIAITADGSPCQLGGQ
jgi:uncharacterized protein (TIGR03437 family)